MTWRRGRLSERDVTERDNCFSQTQACPASTTHRPENWYYGPTSVFFLASRPYRPAKTSKTFLSDRSRKIEIRPGGGSHLARSRQPFFYAVPKKAKNSREAGLAKPLSKNVRRDRTLLKQDKAHYKSREGEKNREKKHMKFVKERPLHTHRFGVTRAFALSSGLTARTISTKDYPLTLNFDEECDPVYSSFLPLLVPYAIARETKKILCQVKMSFSLTYGNKTKNLGTKRTTPSERAHSVGLGNISTRFLWKSFDGEKGSQTRKKLQEVIKWDEWNSKAYKSNLIAKKIFFRGEEHRKLKNRPCPGTEGCIRHHLPQSYFFVKRWRFRPHPHHSLPLSLEQKQAQVAMWLQSAQ